MSTSGERLGRAVVRGVSGSFSRALSRAPSGPIDVSRAALQHAAYVAKLVGAGLRVTALPPDEAYPDGCFVEDAAVIAEGLALVCRSAAPTRKGEAPSVAAELARWMEVAKMEGPATLDGGDCLRLGRRLFVGLSQRTNVAGLERLRELFVPRGLEVIGVSLPPEVLHLKCVCSALGEDRLLLAEGTIEPALFPGAAVVWVPAEEQYAANALRLSQGVVLAAGHPVTRDRLERAGERVVELDVSEFRKADGSLTCLALLF